MHCLLRLPAGLGDQVVRERARCPVGHLLALRCLGGQPCPDCPVPLSPVRPTLSLPTMGVREG